MSDRLLESQVEAVLQEAQDAVLGISLPNNLLMNSIVRPPVECWRMLSRGVSHSDLWRGLMRYVGGVYVTGFVVVLASQGVGSLDRALVAQCSALTLLIVPILFAVLRAPVSTSRGAKAADPILRVAATVGAQNLGTGHQLDLVEKGLRRREARSSTVVTSLKWFMGTSWAAWIYLFLKAVEAQASSPAVVHETSFALALGLLIVGAVAGVVMAYSAATEAVFTAAFDGLDEARNRLLVPSPIL